MNSKTRSIASLLVACVLLVAGAEVTCFAKEEKKTTPTFGSFGGSAASKQKESSPAPAPAAPKPAVVPVNADSSTKKTADSSAGSNVTTPAFGQFGPAKKVEPALIVAPAIAPAVPVVAAGQQRSTSATDTALAKAAAQAQALRTLDGRQSGQAVASAKAAGPADSAQRASSLSPGGARQDARAGAFGATGGTVAGAQDRIGQPQGPVVAPVQSTGYQGRSDGLSDVAAAVLMRRATAPRPTVVVRDGGDGADWGAAALQQQPMPPVVVEAPAISSEPSAQAAQTPAQPVADGEGFPWSSVFGLCVLVAMAIGVVVWMTKGRPVHKRYSL